MGHHIEGAANFGGTMSITEAAVGPNARYSAGTRAKAEKDAETESVRRCHVGVITILPVEAQAVRRVLGLERETINGIPFQTGTVDGVSVAAVRTLDQGQQSVMAAYDHLVREFDPVVVAVTGIGGAIHGSVRLGDVVVATEMVYYDLRKITKKGTVPRGFTRPAPAPVIHAVHAFFEDLEESRLTVTDHQGRTRRPAVRFGPVGSGGAVIADEDAEEIAFLARFNDKILAVEMEAGGLSQACHERSAHTGRTHGWVVIRGMSDRADHAKRDAPQPVAALHAAHVLRGLLPYLGTDLR